MASPLTYGSRRRASLFPVELPLDWAAAAVCDAYLVLGELSDQARGSLEMTPRPDGWLRVSLPAGTADETARLMSALGELLEEAAAPRYLISRQACVQATRTSPMLTVWYPVPADLARRRDRADALHLPWTRWVGPSELVYLDSAPEATRKIATTTWETSARRIWC
jgi:hypothetical protein